jgi:thiol-disulfide isomerase/thioredoxin
MKAKYFFFIIIFSCLTNIAIAPLRLYDLGGFRGSSLVGFIVFFYLTIFCFKKFGQKLTVWQLLIALMIGRWFLDLPLRITRFESSLISLPELLLHTLGIICGFFYWQLKKPANVLTVFVGCLITVFMFYQGWDYWLHKLNHGTFTGKVTPYILPVKFEAFGEQKNMINDNNFANKIVVLDFWTTTCGVCFRKFPQLQAFDEKYKSDSSVVVLAVNTPIEEDKPAQAFNDIRERGYTFPVVITKDEDMAEKLGVKGYPTTFVINRNGQIIFKGDIEGAIKTVENLK